MILERSQSVSRSEEVPMSHTYSQVSIDPSKETSTNTVHPIFFLSVRDVIACKRIAEFFSETKIDDVDEVYRGTRAHDKVGWFDVAVNKMARMNVSNARYLWR